MKKCLNKSCDRLKQTNIKLVIENMQFKKKEDELQGLITINEENRKQFLEKLQKQKVINEKLNNQVIEFKHTNSLIKMETDIIGDRLNILNDSIKSLGNFKEQEGKTALYPGIETPDSTTKYTYKMLLLDKAKEIYDLRTENDQLRSSNASLLDERDN